MSCGVGHRSCSDSTLLWLWPASTAPIRPLAWKPPYAVGAALEKAKKKNKKTKKPVESYLLKLPWEQNSKETSKFPNTVFILVLKAVSSFEKKGALICASSHGLISWLHVWVLPHICRIPNRRNIVPLDLQSGTWPGSIMRNIRRQLVPCWGVWALSPHIRPRPLKSSKSWCGAGGKLSYKGIR